jgi:hypothetical protein
MLRWIWIRLISIGIYRIFLYPDPNNPKWSIDSNHKSAPIHGFQSAAWVTRIWSIHEGKLIHQSISWDPCLSLSISFSAANIALTRPSRSFFSFILFA